MSYVGVAKRTDLQFRSEYPEIETIIYKITEMSFVIYFETASEDTKQIMDFFENSIRPMSAPIFLKNEKPNVYEEIIPSIADNEISKGFEGISLTRPMLFNLLLSKFPNVKFYKIELVPDGKLLVCTAKYREKKDNVTLFTFLNTGDREKITKFLEELNLPFGSEIIDQEVEEIPNDFSQFEHEPIQVIHAAKLRKDREYDFAKRDEALWFDNIDKIFNGNFHKKDLYFFNTDSYSCYVDFSIFSNIHIRNHLLLFETVYITLPFETNIEKWLNTSQISKNEFLDLIARGRIKLILTQMESRYDIGFILEAYAANPEGVITRRALATLQQVDIIEMSNNYLLNDSQLLKELMPIVMDAAKKNGIDPKFMYEMLVWPLKARRKSFEPLLIKGIFSTSVFGINNAIERKISESTGHDLSFDFVVNASAIHLANSLEATYFPYQAEGGYSDQFYANVMGDLLNFYKSANIPNLKSFLDSKERIYKGVMPINPIDIITVNDYFSISDLEREIAKTPTFKGGKLLMETLAPLNEQEREQKINFYNIEVVKRLNGNKTPSSAIDLGTNAALDTAGIFTGFPFIGTAFSVLKIGGKAIKNSDIGERFNEKIDTALNDNPDKTNIHYLTKINRVAKLKRKF